MSLQTGLTLPCYAVIFTSKLDLSKAGYDEMASQMNALVQKQEGFLKMESVHNNDGQGITVCYWRTIKDVKRWKEQTLHKQAQQLGKEKWYLQYAVRIAEVQESYEWN